ncbi:pentatricopeptide repeat-containing protein At1g06140, mitochondrial-like isoform X2 [Cicer arietinum]|uniref:Pentatricopeptide repeat-containing protein At1g06140, mitochondrial-like n=2 Tax=Cicer arietinum TaxID=3827 RepID=A0A1S3EI99_CICAR|nr:pentatricopeptide repeat-containing protein At1g06140, mitochondrial-like [Cicer arietinum]
MDEARKVFDFLDEKSIVSWTTIMGGYMKVGCFIEAFKLFNQMQRQSIDIDFVVLLNLISGCVQLGKFFLASSVHSLVLKCGCGEADSIQNLLIAMYANCGNLTFARRIFDAIVGKSVLSWTSMIAGYTRSGHPSEALNLFRRMVRTKTRPNGATLAIVLSACADLGSLNTRQDIEEYVFENGFESDQQVQTSLIHMYSKCGSIKKAREVFDRVKDKDLTIWTSMINSYAIHGMGDEAISLFEKMTTSERLKPDAIVYTSLLLACSHSGLIEDGLKYFKSMQTDFGITPTIEHYTCLVDLLGRVGHLDLALDTIQAMPLELQTRAWGSLLSACRIHDNVKLGELAAVKLLELSPGSSGSYVLMANLYTSVGKFNEANTMRNLIDGKRMVKECGWSQVKVSG